MGQAEQTIASQKGYQELIGRLYIKMVPLLTLPTQEEPNKAQ